MFTVDSSEPTPLYAQLERSIRAAVARGQVRAGEQLPTVRQLAVDLRINANTVAKVYAELERAGVVETRRGVGTFVRAPAEVSAPDSERQRRLGIIADRYLSDAAALGFSPDEAIAALEAWGREWKRENSDA